MEKLQSIIMCCAVAITSGQTWAQRWPIVWTVVSVRCLWHHNESTQHESGEQPENSRRTDIWQHPQWVVCERWWSQSSLPEQPECDRQTVSRLQLKSTELTVWKRANRASDATRSQWFSERWLPSTRGQCPTVPFTGILCHTVSSQTIPFEWVYRSLSLSFAVICSESVKSLFWGKPVFRR